MNEQDDLYSPSYFQGLLEAEKERVVAKMQHKGSLVSPEFIKELTEAESGDRPRIVERHSALVNGDLERLQEINDSLERIKNGTYGKCLDCDKPILPDRLVAIPTASLCVSCKAQHKGAGALFVGNPNVHKA